MPDQEHIDTGLDDLDAARLKKLNAGKNTSHTRVYTVSGLLQSIRKQIDQTVTDNTRVRIATETRLCRSHAIKVYTGNEECAIRRRIPCCWRFR